MNFIQRFSKLKCTNHPELPIQNLCLAENCTQHPAFCQRCTKLHLAHAKHIIFVSQLNQLLTKNSNVNEIIQDKAGLEALKTFLHFKHSIEDKLNNLEAELRHIISTYVDSQLLNQQAEKFLKEVNDFDLKDLQLLKKRILERMSEIKNNSIFLKEMPQKKQLNDLTAYLKDKIPSLQKEILNHLEATNTTFYIGNEQVIRRLGKVLIEQDGQSRPSNFNNTLVRATKFTVKDQPLYLTGIYQPILYQGSFNSSNYNSQNAPHTLIIKIHEGSDLRSWILEHQFEVYHEVQVREKQLEIVDGHCYNVQFKRPLKLQENHEYTISITTSESKQIFVYQYSNPILDNEFITFQSQDLHDCPKFYKSPFVKQIYAYTGIDQVPALVVKCMK